MLKEYQLKIDDLKQENMQLKKQVNKLMNNITSSKVQIRKLDTECKKKDKEIYFLTDPKNVNCKIFQQRICENGANFIIRLKRENEKLRKELAEKDMIINRLNKELRATNIYLPLDKDKRKVDGEIDSHNTTKRPDINSRNENHKIGDTFKDGCSDLERLYANFQKIKENIRKNSILEGGDNNARIKSYGDNIENHTKTESNSNEESDSTLSSNDFEFSCDTPHEEIRRIENYFVEMFTEVDDLKLTISELQKKQEKISQMCLYEKNMRKIRQKRNNAMKKKSATISTKTSTTSLKTLGYQSITEEPEDDLEKTSVKSDFNIYSDYVEISHNSREFEA